MFNVSANTLNRVVIFSVTFAIVEISKSFTVCWFLKHTAISSVSKFTYMLEIYHMLMYLFLEL